MNAYEEYMKAIVQPMRQELVDAGFTELTTEDEVHEFMATTKGITLVVINSVCGCAAGSARPAVREAIKEIKPDNLVTVFAGQDREATAAMRSYFEEVPPSSPSIAILRDGQLEYFIPREQIEGYPVEQIRDHIVGVLKQACAK
ncbi:BrxA/BrxB family bacilliredoxin [Ureibacillus sp. FSL K6-8385]|uniref:BrxA/BrxB family bacilliredoxin n=1 Tax=Ureibacillus terrenus TaxID=118246 RepID=A0A540V1D0_9BACL|nr:BrxA/BrxB family bacilliredoxin [Ureibacillus terrenus]MED3662688.1 BrxA/BrxB family bacilliredoxin [Ureibacillus terrenus]MED3764511.1 BrxA/BrxB family bacilliredoxin [Ureibacillus terrenus]TQE90531.1 BrxA/BrxB family bacilliredoxin [Ureibacillus terrenus]